MDDTSLHLVIFNGAGAMSANIVNRGNIRHLKRVADGGFHSVSLRIGRRDMVGVARFTPAGKLIL